MIKDDIHSFGEDSQMKMQTLNHIVQGIIRWCVDLVEVMKVLLLFYDVEEGTTPTMLTNSVPLLNHEDEGNDLKAESAVAMVARLKKEQPNHTSVGQ